MKSFIHFLLEKKSTTSEATRYSSEIGTLFAFIEKKNNTIEFNPNKPEETIDANLLFDSKQTIYNIKKYLSKNFNNDLFKIYYEKGKELKSKIKKLPKLYGWAAVETTSEEFGSSDVLFKGIKESGISIKSKNFTLKNLTIKALGINPEKQDIFKKYASEEFDLLQKTSINGLLNKAKNKKDIWIENGIRYNSKDNTFSFKYPNDTQPNRTITENEIMQLPKDLFSVFGRNILSHPETYKEMVLNLITQFRDNIDDVITENIKNNFIQFIGLEDRPYYLITFDKTYYVISKNEISKTLEVTVKPSVKQSTDNIGFSVDYDIFITDIINNNKETASVRLSIRYKDGIFNKFPVVTSGNIKGFEKLFWQEI